MPVRAIARQTVQATVYQAVAPPAKRVVQAVAKVAAGRTVRVAVPKPALAAAREDAPQHAQESAAVHVEIIVVEVASKDVQPDAKIHVKAPQQEQHVLAAQKHVAKLAQPLAITHVPVSAQVPVDHIALADAGAIVLGVHIAILPVVLQMVATSFVQTVATHYVIQVAIIHV
jgi:hypothetical protein